MTKKYFTMDEILGANKVSEASEATEQLTPEVEEELRTYANIMNGTASDTAAYADWDGTEEPVSEEEARHRLATLDRYMRGIRNIMMGRRYNFLQDVEDRDRQLDEEKVRAFIREMIECHPDKETMSDDDRRFFECFLYCAIAGPSVVNSMYSPLCGETQVAPARFLQDFLSLAEDRLFQSDNAVSFAAREECERAFPESFTGFTYFMNEMYARLTGKTEWDIYSPKELDEVIEIYAEIHGEDPDEIRRSMAEDDEAEAIEDDEVAEAEPEVVGEAEAAAETDEHETTTPAAEPSEPQPAEDEATIGSYEIADDSIVLPEPPAEYMQGILQRQEELGRECADSWKRLLEHLPEKNCLTEIYPELRRRAFSRDNTNLIDEVTRMVDTYINRHRLSFLYHTGKFNTIEQMLSKPYNFLYRWI